MTTVDPVFIKKIEKIGLSDKAAQVYATLLETGGSYPSKVAEMTKLNRSTVYRLLTDLAVKGLVTEIEKRNKIYYQPEHPKNMVRFADMQITLAKERADDARKMLPDMEALFAVLPEKPKIRFFNGIDGVMQVYDDHITQEEPYEMVGWSNTAKLLKFLPKTYLPNYVQEKQKRKITSRGIFPDSDGDQSYSKTMYKYINQKYVPQFKCIPSQQFPYESEITLYGKKHISIINFHEHNPVGVIIEDQIIHNMMRMIFELTWNGLKA